MWPFKKKVRFVDLLTKHFGGGSDGPALIASDGEFIRSFPWIRFTCRGLDYCLERDRVALKYGYYVQVGRADRPGRPEDISAFGRLSLEDMQAYSEDMFYWEDVQVALGEPEISRDIHQLALEQVNVTLSCLEPQLHRLFSGDAYVSLRAVRNDRVEARKAELRRLGQQAL